MRLKLLHEADVDLRSLQRGDQRDEAKLAINNLRHGTGASKEMIELAAQLGNPLAMNIMQEYFEEAPTRLSVAHYDVSEQRREFMETLVDLLGKEALADVTAECFLQAAGLDHQARRELEIVAETVRNLNTKAAALQKPRMSQLNLDSGGDENRWDLPILAALSALNALLPRHPVHHWRTSPFVGSMGYSINISLMSGVDMSVPDKLFADRLMSSE